MYDISSSTEQREAHSSGSRATYLQRRIAMHMQRKQVRPSELTEATWHKEQEDEWARLFHSFLPPSAGFGKVGYRIEDD